MHEGSSLCTAILPPPSAAVALLQASMNVTTLNPACLRKIAIESDERLQMPLLFYQVGTADNMNLFNTAVHWLASARPVEPSAMVHGWHRCTWSLYMCDIANMENMDGPALQHPAKLIGKVSTATAG